MAKISDQHSNQISELMQLAEEQLDLQNRIQSAISRYNQNGLFDAVEEAQDLIDSGFAHLTQSEIGNCINALTAVNTALGDLVTGEAVNLEKMKG